MPTKAPPTYDWTGFYVGAHFGGAFDIEDGTVGAAVLGGAMTKLARPRAAHLGGFQLGYNWQVAPHWLAGVEGELSWSAIEGRTNYINTTTAVSLQSNYNNIQMLAARLGYVRGPLLTYVKLGGAWANIDYTVMAVGAVSGTATVNAERSGWMFGTGIEYELSRTWSAKAEYSFLDFGSQTVASNSDRAGRSARRPRPGARGEGRREPSLRLP